MLKYGLGRQTVRRAFQELVADGLVYRVRGRGTFPTTRPKSGGRTVRSTGSIEALEEWSGTEMEVISPLELRRDLEYAQRLELDEPVVARLTVRRWIDDEPFAVTDIFLPPDVGSRLVSEDKIPTGRVAGTILAFVGAMAGPVASADKTVTAITVPASLAETLHSVAGRPALRVECVYRNVDGRPLQISATGLRARGLPEAQGAALPAGAGQEPLGDHRGAGQRHPRADRRDRPDVGQFYPLVDTFGADRIRTFAIAEIRMIGDLLFGRR